MASTAAIPNPSTHSEGIRTARVRRKTSSRFLQLLNKVTFRSPARAIRSVAVVPQPGSAANLTSGMARASAKKIEIPFTAQAFINNM